jgi:hypothetical protein
MGGRSHTVRPRMLVGLSGGFLVLALVFGSSALGGGGNSANAKMCKKNGWVGLVRADGSEFENQAACVSYGAKGGVIYPISAKPCLVDGGYTYKATSQGDPFATVDACIAYLSGSEPLVACTIIGTNGDDTFASVPIGAVACGFGGNDDVPFSDTPVAGTFFGGAGDDTAFVFGSGTFYGGAGSDSANVVGGVFYGGAGDDLAFAFGATVYGGDGNDTAGLGHGSTFYGGAGDDTAPGVDRGLFDGGSGNDHADALFLSTFNGGDGNDSVGTIDGPSTFNGDAGNDTANTIGLYGTFNGGDGDDHADTLDGGAFNGDAGYNTLCTFISGSYTDVVIGCT